MFLLFLKTIHILAAFMNVGAGFMTAYHKFQGDRSGRLEVIAWCQREIIRTDWLFSVPSGILLPLTGLGLASLYGLPLSTPWLLWGMIGFLVMFFLWLPAAFLQMSMKKMADRALEKQEALPQEFYRANRIWNALGAAAFLAAVFVIWVMTAKWPR